MKIKRRKEIKDNFINNNKKLIFFFKTHKKNSRFM